MTRVLIVRNRISDVVQGGSFSHGDEVSFDAPGIALASVRDSLRSTIEATGSGSNIVLPSPYYVPNIATDDFSGYDDSTRGRCIRCMYTANTVFDLCFAWDRGGNAVENEVLRVDWWIRFQTLGGGFPAEADDNGGTTAAGDDWQHKLFRYRFDRDSVLDAGASGDIYAAHWDNSDGSFFCGEFSPWHWVNGASSSSAPQLAPFVNNVSGRRAGGDDYPVAYGQLWAKCELVAFMGSGANGRLFLYVRKEGEERRLVGSITGMDWFAGGRNFRYFYWQNYLGNAASDTAFNGTWIAHDDVRVQRHSSSVACDRAILMSHPTLAETYAAGGWYEDQDITGLVGDTVTIGSLNTGANRTGTCYLAGIGTDPTTREDSIYGSATQIEVT